jgi:streptomycin 6-kinase
MNFDLQRYRLWAFAYGALSVLWFREDGLNPSLPLYIAGELRREL